MRVAVIINPVSGAHGRPQVAQHRAQLAMKVLTREQVAHEVFITERMGHAYELAHAAVAHRTSLVFAWGGDGTINEVGRALAFGPVALGIIPAGSGNGLARELRVPTQPEQALKSALRANERLIDVGELGGRLFFNAAGFGFDVHVTTLFNSRPKGRRGLLGYLTIATRELFAYQSQTYTITANGEPTRHRALLIALANSRQYGNGALVAPQARLDDGALDLVIVEGRSPLATLWEARRLFNGSLLSARGVITKRVTQLTVSGQAPLQFHVDGEPMEGASSLTASVHPGALRIRVERAAV